LKALIILLKGYLPFTHLLTELAALLEGRVILDNLGIATELKRLRERLMERGAYISKRGVKFPRQAPH
jgi:HEPN domain-containing protein